MGIPYRSLKQKHEEIRLLDLEAAKTLDDPLCATLRHVELKHANFSALSYVWGDEDVDRSDIFITYAKSSRGIFGSKAPETSTAIYKHNVGSSLARALRHLRQKYGNITLWTDALCINQDKADKRKEKDWQVPLMKAIYSQAKEVHAWLGPRFDEDVKSVLNVNVAFSVAEKIWGLSNRLPGSPNQLPEETWLEFCFYLANAHQASNQTQRAWNEFSATLRLAAASDSQLHNDLESLTILSQNAYFSRIWILQETGRARRLTFHFGMKNTSHRHILLALSLANSLQRREVKARNEPASTRFDHRFLGCLTARTTCMQERSLVDVLSGAYLSDPPLHKATNPKDIIYARLGLAESLGGFKVQYELSLPNVYIEVSRFLLSEGYLDILSTFRPYNFRKGIKEEGFPSWAYDWSKKGSNKFDKYNASGSMSQRVTIAPYPHSEYKHALLLSGTNIGNIYYTKERFSAVAIASGLHQKTVVVGSAFAVSENYSAEKKMTIIGGLTLAYSQIGIDISTMDLEALLETLPVQLALFWCWWVRWIASLVPLIDEANILHPVSGFNCVDVAELLFREGQVPSKSTESFEFFGTRAGMLALVDYKRWTPLLSREPNQDGPDNSTLSQFTESLFRSAWGMRPAVLQGGRLGYVPEDAKPHDSVVIFYGVKAPLVIRKVASDAYRIIGPAHICGAMQGELMQSAVTSFRYKII